MPRQKNVDREELKAMHESGLSYNKIREITGLSKSTISWHLSKKARSKVTEYRANRNKNSICWKLSRKTDHFLEKTLTRKPAKPSREKPKRAFENKSKIFKRIKSRIGTKASDFKKTDRIGNMAREFGYKDLLKHFGYKGEITDEGLANWEAKCAYSGRKLNLLDTTTYSFDHIVPRAKGGTNDMDNCALTSREANQAKSDLSKDEFLKLCEDVLRHHGYKVEEPDSFPF